MDNLLSGLAPSRGQAERRFVPSLQRGGVLFLGAVAGMLAGAAAGRLAFPLSLATTVAGAYYGQEIATAAGAGMLAGTAAISKNAPVSGMDFKGEFEASKQRVLDVVRIGIPKSVWWDKIAPPSATNGLGVTAEDVMFGLGMGEMGGPDYSGAPRFTFDGPQPLAALSELSAIPEISY